MASLPIVNSIDKRKGIITAVFTMLLLLLYLWFTTFEMADPPPQDVIVEATTEFPKEIILENLKIEGGSGAGKASDAILDEPKPKTEKLITKTDNKDTQVNTGKANTTNSSNSQNNNTTPTKSSDPFASGGNGTGDDGGSGDKFGGDSGTGTAGNGGNGGGNGRIRKNDPVINGLGSNVDVTIHLKLTIDAEGNVISASNIKAQTTTSNQVLINRVINEVKKQVKYNKEPGAPLAKVFMPVYIKAQ
ncbi:MAG: hypothetical protein QNK85_02430 [Crocinitomicaceae bacterium]|jgi:hypothetical protein